MSWGNIIEHVDKHELEWAKRSAEFECPKAFERALDDLDDYEEEEEENLKEDEEE
jgi:hypothetical protein